MKVFIVYRKFTTNYAMYYFLGIFGPTTLYFPHCNFCAAYYFKTFIHSLSPEYAAAIKQTNVGMTTDQLYS